MQQGGNTGHSSGFHLRRLGTASCFPFDTVIIMDENMHFALTRCEKILFTPAQTDTTARSQHRESTVNSKISYKIHFFSIHQIICAEGDSGEEGADTSSIVFT